MADEGKDSSGGAAGHTRSGTTSNDDTENHVREPFQTYGKEQINPAGGGGGGGRLHQGIGKHARTFMVKSSTFGQNHVSNHQPHMKNGRPKGKRPSALGTLDVDKFYNKGVPITSSSGGNVDGMMKKFGMISKSGHNQGIHHGVSGKHQRIQLIASSPHHSTQNSVNTTPRKIVQPFGRKHRGNAPITPNGTRGSTPATPNGTTNHDKTDDSPRGYTQTWQSKEQAAGRVRTQHREISRRDITIRQEIKCINSDENDVHVDQSVEIDTLTASKTQVDDIYDDSEFQVGNENEPPTTELPGLILDQIAANLLLSQRKQQQLHDDANPKNPEEQPVAYPTPSEKISLEEKGYRFLEGPLGELCPSHMADGQRISVPSIGNAHRLYGGPPTMCEFKEQMEASTANLADGDFFEIFCDDANINQEEGEEDTDGSTVIPGSENNALGEGVFERNRSLRREYTDEELAGMYRLHFGDIPPVESSTSEEHEFVEHSGIKELTSSSSTPISRRSSLSSEGSNSDRNNSSRSSSSGGDGGGTSGSRTSDTSASLEEIANKILSTGTSPSSSVLPPTKENSKPPMMPQPTNTIICRPPTMVLVTPISSLTSTMAKTSTAYQHRYSSCSVIDENSAYRPSPAKFRIRSLGSNKELEDLAERTFFMTM